MSFALILVIVEMHLYPKSQDIQKKLGCTSLVYSAAIQNWHKEHLLELFEIALQRPGPVLAPVLW